MKAARPGRWALIGLAASAVGTATHAQAQAPYVDREIPGLAQEAPPPETEDSEDRSGWPRLLRLQARLANTPFDGASRARPGYAIFGVLETPNHGTLSADGQLSEGEATVTLRQLGLPLAGGWRADHELGLVNAPVPDLLRQPSRIFLPSANLLGARALWQQPAQGWQLLAGFGEPGELQSLPITAFQGLGGRRQTLGLQWRWGPPLQRAGQLPGWSAAFLSERAHGTTNANATLMAVRHDTPEHQVQGQWLSDGGAMSGTGMGTGAGGGRRQGLWIDAVWPGERLQRSAGLYRLEPDLSWAGQSLPNDLQGVYTRLRWTTRQWSADASFDALDSVSGRRAAGYFAAANARWRLSRDASAGLGGSLRRFGAELWTVYGDLRWRNPWGPNGVRLELDGGADQRGALRVSHDQEWPVPAGWSLSSTVGLAWLRADATASAPSDARLNAALSLAIPLGDRASVRGNIGWERGRAGDHRTSINLGAQWQLDRHWALEATVLRVSGRAIEPIAIDPLAPPLPDTRPLLTRSVFLALRYERQGGSRSVPLGGDPGAGGGRVEGVVFFDANRNGTQEANETGVPNASVFLDNRYAVRTDAQGRFVFPFVGSGRRSLILRNDSLPLPWSAEGEGRAEVDVQLREALTVRFAVQRAD